MAKPRIFVSSTYYDLKHIRNSLESFISQFGYESILFESGDIPFHHTQPLDESCYSEINNCHILILIIGGRYGSGVSDDENKESADTIYKSITKKEYETAKAKDIPIYIFVDKSVMAEYQTYKENKHNSSIIYAHVDSIGVFHLLDDILNQGRNNLIKEFEKFDDISSWLTDQWAGLFADFLSRRSSEATLKNLSSQVEELKQLSSVLKSYNESIIRKLEPEASTKIITDSDNKLRRLQASRLCKEALIRYIIRNTEKPISTMNVYNNFEASSDLEDFLERLETPSELKREILTTHKNQASIDYEELAYKYLNRQIDIIDIADE
ncbi:DUF4062 domain-containing protein [Aeromonas caviae]|uniref:DUF4062 domain-containing protein n=1 Tax=Aeromonas caviae TaxID=648 RepID=UPI002B46AC36|nr:DUF4062 domain-containing protein [Aeromonas caviae]